MAKFKAIVINVEKDGNQVILKVVHTGNPNDIDIEDGDEIQIEVPSHAPPPENP
jgi:hypothetical protein